MNENVRKNITWKTINKMFHDNPNFLINHHLNSYNMFFEEGIKQIFKNNNPLRILKEQDQETKKYKYTCNIYFGGKNVDKIYYGKPVIYDEFVDQTSREHYMYPNEARLRNMTYGFSIHYDVELEFILLLENDKGKIGDEKFITHKETLILEKKYLGRFPIMIGSKMCILNGLSKETKFNLGECRNDLGGYFIIDGKEKVIISQEGRADNVLYIKSDFNELYSHVAEIRSVSEDVSKPIRTLSIRFVKETPTMSNNQIVVNIPNVRKPIPFFIVFRALGVISDKEIIEYCLLDLDKYDNYMELLRPSVHDTGDIYTQESALNFIATFTKRRNVMEILMNFLLPHIGELNFNNKALYLGYMVKRLLDVYSGSENDTDRDSYSRKRIEPSGILIKNLFREYYLMQMKDIFKKIDKEYFYKATGVTYQNADFINLIVGNQNNIFNDRIVENGFKRAFKGDWGAEMHTKKTGVVQDLNRLSYFYTLCSLRKTVLPIAADGAKIVAPRLLHSTQWGLLCPIHSPDGGNVGLHKHLSTSTHITSGVSIKKYINYLKSLKYNNDFVGIKLLEECPIQFLSNTTKVIINGFWIGNTVSPIEMCKLMRLHKRNNIIDTFTSIYFNIRLNEINIFTDGGRPIRPLFYMYNDEMSYERGNILKLYDSDELSWNDLINGFGSNVTDYSSSKRVETLEKEAAVLEYVDTQEAEGMVLAKNSEKRDNYKEKRITNEEIHPSLILSIMANQIIFPEHNPYPRNAFSCGQGKQGVGLFHTNYRNRVDKTGLMLNYGQIPLTKSRYYTYSTKDEHSYGENAIVAIMCYSGFNVEDAVIINRGFLERGGFSTTKFEVYETFEESSKVGNTNIDTKFLNIEDNNVVGLKPGYDYSKLDKHTGIIKENSIVDEKTVLIGKVVQDESNTLVDMSVFPKKGAVGVVDKAFITEGQEGKRIAKVRIRAHRQPAIGDKFCSRAGQKGTVGIILDAIDMPTTSTGLTPDIIVNPHAMPSRMTIGHMVETITSKIGAIFGGFGDCTAFNNKGSQHEIYGQYLVNAGLEKSGHEILYNGMTGEQLEADIYIGPTYYLRLKHMPKDKINYRGRGPRTVLTRQTVGGRANDGGLRIGEMDRDCLLAHGMNAFIKDSMLVRGDEFYVAVCNQTGYVAAYNEKQNLFLCPFADGPIKFVKNVDQQFNVVNVNRFGRDFSIIRVPYAFKLLMQELQCMNVQMRIITEDNVNQLMSLVKGHDLKRITGFQTYKEYEDALYKKVLAEESKFRLKDFKPSLEEYEENSFDVPQNPFYDSTNMVFGQTYNNIYDNEGEFGYTNTFSSMQQFGTMQQGVTMIPGQPIKTMPVTSLPEVDDDDDFDEEFSVFQRPTKKSDLTIKIPTQTQQQYLNQPVDSTTTGYEHLLTPTSPEYDPNKPHSPAYDPNNPSAYKPPSPEYDPNKPPSPAYDPNNPSAYQPISPAYHPTSPEYDPNKPSTPQSGGSVSSWSDSDSDSGSEIGFKPKLKILNDIDTAGIKTLATIDGGGDNKKSGDDNNNGNDGNVKKSVKVNLDK